MSLILDKNYFVNSIKNVAKVIEKNRDHLTQLDSEIGDGDHGINLSIGFRAVEKDIDDIAQNTEDISKFLKKIGMTLLGSVGGASGPLYGSYFMKMSTNFSGKTEVDLKDFTQMIEQGVESVEKRGKAVVGQKTMVDALRPGVDFLKEQALEEDGIKTFEKFITTMKDGAEETIEMFPEKGRAARLGERAVGHKDPGAESSWMIMNAFLEEMKNANMAVHSKEEENR